MRPGVALSDVFLTSLSASFIIQIHAPFSCVFGLDLANAYYSFSFFQFSVGKPTHPQPVKLVASLICGNNEALCAALGHMSSRWGSLDFVSEIMAFDYTDYYEEEMGKNLWRKIVSFEKLRQPDRLSHIKQSTNGIEALLSPERSRRSVNIDPGYINAHHLILATTKPGPHRPYLRDGIYADLALLYTKKTFRSLRWTYPDYQSEKMIATMNIIRTKYLFQARKVGGSRPHPPGDPVV